MGEILSVQPRRCLMFEPITPAAAQRFEKGHQIGGHVAGALDQGFLGSK